jgi:hypothetical protein
LLDADAVNLAAKKRLREYFRVTGDDVGTGGTLWKPC